MFIFKFLSCENVRDSGDNLLPVVVYFPYSWEKLADVADAQHRKGTFFTASAFSYFYSNFGLKVAKCNAATRLASR